MRNDRGDYFRDQKALWTTSSIVSSAADRWENPENLPHWRIRTVWCKDWFVSVWVSLLLYLRGCRFSIHSLFHPHCRCLSSNVADGHVRRWKWVYPDSCRNSWKTFKLMNSWTRGSFRFPTGLSSAASHLRLVYLGDALWSLRWRTTAEWLSWNKSRWQTTDQSTNLSDCRRHCPAVRWFVADFSELNKSIKITANPRWFSSCQKVTTVSIVQCQTIKRNHRNNEERTTTSRKCLTREIVRRTRSATFCIYQQ